MVQFCTNCGTKLDDDDLFCMNCGSKVDGSDNKSKKSLFKTMQDDIEKNKAKKQLKRVCGGFILNKTFINKLLENGLDNITGSTIKKQVVKEIESGQIKSNYVENRVNELIIEYKNIAEKEKQEKEKQEKEKSKIIEELFESEVIQSKIKEYDFSESQVNSIKSRVQNIEIVGKNENVIEGEIKHNIRTELEKERKNEFRNNRVKYLEDKYHIKLATFEKEYINRIELTGNTISEMKNELNRSAKKIINPHKKIGEYDFVGKLIEEGGFTNAVDIVGLEKRARKDSDLISYVFLKIFENNIKIVGSEIEPIYLSLHITPKYKGIAGKDRTIFFSDITSISYSNGEIHFNLLNKERLILKEEKNSYTGKNIEAFYKLLNTAWENFKNNENELSSINKKEEVSVADELMKYAELYEKGLLTDEEFAAMKKKLIEG